MCMKKFDAEQIFISPAKRFNWIIDFFELANQTQRNINFGGILFSACPLFRQHLRVLLYNFDTFSPILFNTVQICYRHMEDVHEEV